MKVVHHTPEDGEPHQLDEACPCRPLGTTTYGDNKPIRTDWHHRRHDVESIESE